MTTDDARSLILKALDVLGANRKLATPARLAVLENVVLPNMRNILAATLNPEQYEPYFEAAESVVQTEKDMVAKFDSLIVGMANHFLSHPLELALLARLL